MIQFKVTHTVRCWCTCSVVHAGVYAGVALQFGGELQLQLMEVLLPDGVLHVRCELDLLCQAQNLKTESLHSHFRWTAETHGCFWRDVLGVCVCVTWVGKRVGSTFPFFPAFTHSHRRCFRVFFISVERALSQTWQTHKIKGILNMKQEKIFIYSIFFIKKMTIYRYVILSYLILFKFCGLVAGFTYSIVNYIYLKIIIFI